MYETCRKTCWEERAQPKLGVIRSSNQTDTPGVQNVQQLLTGDTFK